MEKRFADMASGDEMVRHISELPCYLERGMNLHDRAFSTGVLEWKHLEKWQQHPKPTLLRTSTDFMSNFPTRDHCHSLVCQRMPRSASSGDPVKPVKNNVDKSNDKSPAVGRENASKVKAKVQTNGTQTQKKKPKMSNDIDTYTSEEFMVLDPSGALENKHVNSREQTNDSKCSTVPWSDPMSFELHCGKKLQLKQPSCINSERMVNTAAKSVSENVPSFSLMDRLSDSFMLRPLKAKLGLIGCRTVDVWNSQPDKAEILAKQAFLRVTFKKGRPLLTFAVNNDSDVLAATVKKLGSSRKDKSGWIYTLFRVPAIKRNKARKISGGCRVQNQHYIPSIIAQMNVSESQSSKTIRRREFVLSAVEQLRQADSGTQNFKINDELAAIVSEIPLMNNIQNELIFESNSELDLKSSSVHGETTTQQNSLFGNGDHIKTTVILPSDVHSLPRKGEPSSLIERWKSGGSCDCGGWDLGCKLRILSSQNHVFVCNKAIASAGITSSLERLTLFSQVEEQREESVFFSLAPSKDEIYSIEFHSSLSELQAFAICIAVLGSRRSLSHPKK